MTRASSPSAAGDQPGSRQPEVPALAGQPSAQALATVRASGRSFSEVVLPARFASAAVGEFLRWFRAEGTVHAGPRSEEWTVRLTQRPLELGFDPAARRNGAELWVFPLHTLRIETRRVAWVLRALEAVKPEERDATGRRLPWVPLQGETERLGGELASDPDEVRLAEPPPPEPDPELAPEAAGGVSTDEVRAHFRRLATLAGHAGLPLTLTRGRVHKFGFASGRVWLAPDLSPLRVHVTTCPNSDLAEILATLVHELAHPLARRSDHGVEFKRELVAFAGRAFGTQWFAAAADLTSQSYRLVDRWICAGVREALLGTRGAPPSPQQVEDGTIAEIATRIRKARALASDRLGTPEGIRATAVANQLVTVYGLEDHLVRSERFDREQWVDRWIVLPGDALWRRRLAHAVMEAFGVFALAHAQRGKPSTMHAFGRYADLQQAEYLFEITQARIDRECARHLEEWKAQCVPARAAATLRERTSFCDSAVLAFARKLEGLGAAADGGEVEGEYERRNRDVLAAAQEFARAEHRKRGMGWGAGSAKGIRANAAGTAFGDSLEVTRGVAEAQQEPRRIGTSGSGTSGSDPFPLRERV